MGGVIDSAVGASPHPILLNPYGVEPQQIKLCKSDITTTTIRLQTYLFAPYRDGVGGAIGSAVGASPHPILFNPYGVEPQQIKP